MSGTGDNSHLSNEQQPFIVAIHSEDKARLQRFKKWVVQTFPDLKVMTYSKLADLEIACSTSDYLCIIDLNQSLCDSQSLLYSLDKFNSKHPFYLICKSLDAATKLPRSTTAQMLIDDDFLRSKLIANIHRRLQSVNPQKTDRFKAVTLLYNLKNIADSMHDPIFFMDYDGFIVDGNEKCIDLLGDFRVKKINLFEYIHPKDGTKFETEMQVAIMEDSLTSVIVRVNTPKLEWQTLHINMQNISNSSEPCLFLCVKNITEIQKSRLTLHETERKFRLFESNISDVLYRYSSLTRKLEFLSPSVTTQTGVLLENFLVDPNLLFSKIIDNKDRTATLNARTEYLNARQFNQPLTIEYRINNANGEIVWIEERQNIELSEDGTNYWINAVLRDITNRKLVEERLNTMLNSMPDTILYQTGGDIEYVSDSIENVLGYPAKEFMHNRQFYLSLIHPDERDYFDSEIEKWIKAGCKGVLEMQLRVKRKDGEYIWVLDRMSLIDVASDGKRTFQGVLLDITEKLNSFELSKTKSMEINAVFKAFPDMYLRFDKEGRILDYHINNTDDIPNFSNDLLGKHVHELFHEEISEQFINAFESARDWNEMISIEYSLYHAKNEQVYEARILPFSEDQNIAVIRNITSRKKQEKLVQSNLTRLSSINKVAKQLMHISTHDEMLDGVIRVMMNETICNIAMFLIGDQEGLIVGRMWGDDPMFLIYPGTTVEPVKNSHTARSIYEKKSAVVNNIGNFSDENVQTLFQSRNSIILLPVVYWRRMQGVIALCAPPGQNFSRDEIDFLESLGSLLNSMMDKAEWVDSLRSSERFLDNLFEQSPISTWISDASGTMVRVNRSLLRLFNIKEEKLLVGKYNIFKDLYLRSNTFLEQIRTVFNEGIIAQIVLDYDFALCGHLTLSRTKNKLVRCAMFPIKNENGIVTNVIVQYFDLTSEQNLYNQLLQAQKLDSISSLAGGIAHDFNNILTNVLVNTTMLMEKFEPESSEYKSLSDIETSVDSASRIIQQLLAISGKTLVKQDVIVIEDILEQVYMLLKGSLPPKISIHFDKPKGKSQVISDEFNIKQALLNICLNARDSMVDGGKITISNEVVSVSEAITSRYELPAGEYVKISVTDTSEGYPKEMLPRVFDPFFIVKPNLSGTGLSLPVAYKIVKNHKGWIEVNSELKKGTVFSVYLPVTKERVSSMKLPDINKIAKGEGRILVVDDEELILKTAKQLLEILGYEVFLCGNGGEALKWLENESNLADLILLDLTMPGISGIQLYHAIKKIRPHIKIILSSGYDFGEQIDEMLIAGVDAFLPKPYRAAKLSHTLREVLDITKNYD